MRGAPFDPSAVLGAGRLRVRYELAGGKGNA